MGAGSPTTSVGDEDSDTESGPWAPAEVADAPRHTKPIPEQAIKQRATDLIALNARAQNTSARREYLWEILRTCFVRAMSLQECPYGRAATRGHLLGGRNRVRAHPTESATRTLMGANRVNIGTSPMRMTHILSPELAAPLFSELRGASLVPEHVRWFPRASLEEARRFCARFHLSCNVCASRPSWGVAVRRAAL